MMGTFLINYLLIRISPLIVGQLNVEMRKEKEPPAATTFSISTNEISYTYH